MKRRRRRLGSASEDRTGRPCNRMRYRSDAAAPRVQSVFSGVQRVAANDLDSLGERRRIAFEASPPIKTAVQDTAVRMDRRPRAGSNRVRTIAAAATVLRIELVLKDLRGRATAAPRVAHEHIRRCNLQFLQERAKTNGDSLQRVRSGVHFRLTESAPVVTRGREPNWQPR